MNNIQITFLIVISLLVSEKALAIWDKNSCYVCDNSVSSSSNIKDYIEIYYKFYEYALDSGSKDSYLSELEVLYSTNESIPKTHLMSALTQDQNTKTWAWIDIFQKQAGEKIDLFFRPYNQREYVTRHWEGGSLRLEVENDFKIRNQTWIGLYWFPRGNQYPTYIRIKGKWHSLGINKNIDVDEIHKITQKMLKSNRLHFSDLSHKKEIRIEDKDNTIKVYKEANVIVVEGALNKNIWVYTTLGKLIKTLVAESDVLHIPVPANHLFFVNVGSGCYKVAL